MDWNFKPFRRKLREQKLSSEVELDLSYVLYMYVFVEAANNGEVVLCFAEALFSFALLLHSTSAL